MTVAIPPAPTGPGATVTDTIDEPAGGQGGLDVGDGDYDRWYTQAFTISGGDAQQKSETFYYDFDVDTALIIELDPTGSMYDTFLYGDDSALCFFDAPWNRGEESWSGVIRGFQIYHGIAMTVQQITDSLADPYAVQDPWFLNINMTPDDITDKSGNGNDLVWVGDERPSLWTE